MYAALNPAERAHAIHRMHLDLFEPEMTAAQSAGPNIIAAVPDTKNFIIIVFNICATLPVSAFGTSPKFPEVEFEKPGKSLWVWLIERP